jgi:hypothetical protein
MAERLIAFTGAVSCERSATVPGLTLRGRTGPGGAGPAAFAFSAPAPADLPDTLEDAVVERLDGGSFRIGSGGREWRMAAAPVHLHRDVGATFYRAVPPRPAPWSKRLFWRVVLLLARSRAGLTLLGALRRS